MKQSKNLSSLTVRLEKNLVESIIGRKPNRLLVQFGNAEHIFSADV